jgi:hypothetical protein
VLKSKREAKATIESVDSLFGLTVNHAVGLRTKIMKMKPTLLLLALLVWAMVLPAQDYGYRTFKDSRIVNTQSVETLSKRRLDIRIAHRFGDLLGDNGGWATFYGLETAADVLIGADYGVTDDLTVGFYRSKGAGSMPDGQAGLRQVLNGTLKYRFVQQQEDGPPVTISALAVTSMSAAEKIEDNPDIIRNFSQFSHRFAYHGQLMIASRLSDRLAAQLTPGYTHRNVVPFNDENGIFSLGLAAKVQVSRVFGLILEYTQPFSELRTTDNGFYPILGIGFEIDSGGHIFQVNLTNATGIMETDYIPYTTTNWLDGEFRLGFTISRLFNL